MNGYPPHTRTRLPWVNLVLFVLTLMSTVAAGAMQAGVDPIADPAGLAEGLPFALTLMTILLCHEFGHYFASRHHHTDATLPYFIPAPSIIGTFGAFIKMTSPIRTRRALIDIGASGPIIGFVVAVAATVVGLSMSEFMLLPPDTEGMLGLGDSILFSWLADVIVGTPPEGMDILLHPMAFAGWIGLFVTSLNLIPIGQLDGGHILYAVLGPLHRPISRVLVLCLALVGAFFWQGWLLWAVLMLVLGLRHPPVLFWEAPLDPARRKVALASLVIFILTFSPEPFIIG